MAGMPGMTSHESAELAFLFPDGDDKGWSKVENGMQHNMAPDVPLVKLDPAVRTELLRQLSLTLDVVRKYPTVKDAEAAGYRRAGPFLPGLGTHYVGGKTNQTGVLTDDDILHPATIIYAGNAPDSPIAPVSCTSRLPCGRAPRNPRDSRDRTITGTITPGSASPTAPAA